MRRPNFVVAAAALAVWLMPFVSCGGDAGAAEIKILSANVFTGVIEEIAQEFGRTTGHKVVIEYHTVGAVRDRVRAGEFADVAILTRPMLDELVQQARISPGSIVAIARSGVGLAVRAGAPKPDIGSVDAFKRVLLAAKSISYPNPARGGASGILLTRAFERLGIVEQMKAKTKFPSPGQFTPSIVASGEAEIGMTQPMEFYAVPGVEFVGWLPPELQSPADFAFTAGILVSAKEMQAGKAFIQFLAGPAAASVFKAKGMEPG